MAGIGEVKQKVEACKAQADQAYDLAGREREALERLDLGDIHETLGEIIVKLAGARIEDQVNGIRLALAVQVNRAVKYRSVDGEAEVFSVFGTVSEGGNPDAAGMWQGMLDIGETADHQRTLIDAMGRSVANAVTALQTAQSELANYGLFRDGAMADVGKIQQHATSTIGHADSYITSH